MLLDPTNPLVKQIEVTSWGANFDSIMKISLSKAVCYEVFHLNFLFVFHVYDFKSCPLPSN